MTTDMTDDVTPECPRCRESREALARERERTSSAATEMLNAARLSCSVLGGMLETRAILGAAPSETVQEAAARVVSERDEARAEVARMRDQRDRAELMDAAVAVRAARIEQEVARLRAIIDGRTVPPTDEVTP